MPNPTPADPIFDGPLAELVALPAAWRARATARRADASGDPIAENMDRLADQLDDALAKARARTRRLSPAAYGALPHVHATAQTVRRWCRQQKLRGAVETAQGWEIPADAPPPAQAEARAA